MRYSSGVKVAFGAVLAVSLLGKLAAARPTPAPDPARSVAALATALNQGGFRTRLVRTSRAPGIILEASGSRCRLLAGEYPPYDTFADVYVDLARPVGPLRYVYRGSLYPHPPKLSALFDFYMWRELRRIGIRTRRAPVFALAATPGCDLLAIPWRQVAELDA